MWLQSKCHNSYSVFHRAFICFKSFLDAKTFFPFSLKEEGKGKEKSFLCKIKGFHNVPTKPLLQMGGSGSFSPHCCYATTENPAEEWHLHSGLSVMGFFLTLSTFCVEFLNTLSIVGKLQERFFFVENPCICAERPPVDGQTDIAVLSLFGRFLCQNKKVIFLLTPFSMFQSVFQLFVQNTWRSYEGQTLTPDWTIIPLTNHQWWRLNALYYFFFAPEK